MKKSKFNIKGMHCTSCSTSIEDKLKEQEGIIKSRVNHESGKAMIIYDENKTNEDDIKQTIEKAGDYQASIISQADENNVEENKSYNKLSNQENMSPKFTLIFGIVAGIAVASFIGFMVMLTQQDQNAAEGETAVSQNTNINTSNNTNTAKTNPSPTPTAKVDVEVNESDHIRGDVNAPVTIVEWSDFQCPYCSRFHDTMKQVMDNYEGQVRWVYKHFPLDSIHSEAGSAAEASECAGDQDKFWEYTDYLFDNQQSISSSYLKTAAEEIGLNTSEFNTCLDSGKYSDRVESDYQEGINTGVKGTPGNFINGQSVPGAVPYEQITATIDSLL